MTIIAGFRCVDGVVICGDTQATTGLSKTHETKVTVKPEGVTAPALLERANLMAVFCGAGDGPFTEMLIRKAWKSAEHATDLEQACDFIESNIEDAYKHYGEIFQREYCPSVSLIYGVKMNGESRLFTADGEVVNPVDAYASKGAGSYIADFLSSRMYKRSLTVHQGAILAAYVLFQAKEHVDGCAGDSHIAVLRNTKQSGMLKKHRVDGITTILERADKRLGEILLACGVLDHEYNAIASMNLDVLGEEVNLVRNSVLKEVSNRDYWDQKFDRPQSLNAFLQLMENTPEPDDLGFIPPEDQL